MNKFVFAYVAAGLTTLSVPAMSAERHWQPISMAQSAVSFAGNNAFIKSREWDRRDDGFVERIKFAEGQIFYDEIYRFGASWVGIDMKQRLRERLADGLNKKEQKYQAGEVLQRNFSTFRFNYLIAQSDKNKCLLGMSMEDRDGRTWHMNYRFCRALNSKTIAKFEDDAFDILTRARFDGGELNKTRFALQDDPHAQAKPTPKKKAATEPTPAKAASSAPKAPAKSTAVAVADYPKLGPVSSMLDGDVIKQPLRQYVTGYQTMASPKALVMSDNGERVFWANRANEADAIERATTNCQTTTKLKCHVVALNDDLAVNLDTIKNKSFK